MGAGCGCGSKNANSVLAPGHRGMLGKEAAVKAVRPGHGKGRPSLLVKVKLGDDTRRLILREQPTAEGVRNLVCDEFRLGTMWVVCLGDASGDEITQDKLKKTLKEMKAAKGAMPMLRVAVRKIKKGEQKPRRNGNPVKQMDLDKGIVGLAPVIQAALEDGFFRTLGMLVEAFFPIGLRYWKKLKDEFKEEALPELTQKFEGLCTDPPREKKRVVRRAWYTFFEECHAVCQEADKHGFPEFAKHTFTFEKYMRWLKPVPLADRLNDYFDRQYDFEDHKGDDDPNAGWNLYEKEKTQAPSAGGVVSTFLDDLEKMEAERAGRAIEIVAKAAFRGVRAALGEMKRLAVAKAAKEMFPIFAEGSEAAEEIAVGMGPAIQMGLSMLVGFADPGNDKFKAQGAFALVCRYAHAVASAIQTWAAGLPNIEVHAHKLTKYLDLLKEPTVKKMEANDYDIINEVIVPFLKDGKERGLPQLYRLLNRMSNDGTEMGITVLGQTPEFLSDLLTADFAGRGDGKGIEKLSDKVKALEEIGHDDNELAKRVLIARNGHMPATLLILSFIRMTSRMTLNRLFDIRDAFQNFKAEDDPEEAALPAFTKEDEDGIDAPPDAMDADYLLTVSMDV